MFVSQPQYEFPFPPALEQPGSQHWRMVELTLHAPWFLLSVEVVDAEIHDCSMTRTICIAWDYDLAEVLRGLDPDLVRGIVCMMPSWQSETGQWASREIHEVWLCKSASGERVVLGDAAGQEFDCGVLPEHELPLQRELLLRMSPARRRKRHQPSSDVSGARGARTERGGT